MNYRRIIALFGGEELDDWEPPKPEWVEVAIGGAGWTEEFLTLKKWGNANPSVVIKNKLFFQARQGGVEVKNCHEQSWQGTQVSHFYFYNQDNDILVMMTKTVEPRRQALFDYAIKIVQDGSVLKFKGEVKVITNEL